MSALFVDVYTKDSEFQLKYKHERITQGLLWYLLLSKNTTYNNQQFDKIL